MGILTVTLVLLAVFVVLIIVAGIKGFFVGAGEEIKRQHMVIKGLVSTFKQNFQKKRLAKKGGAEIEETPPADQTTEEAEE